MAVLLIVGGLPSDFANHAPAVDGLGYGVEETIEKLVILALLFYHVGFGFG